MGADNRSAQLACHQRLGSGSGIALFRLIDIVGVSDVALTGNGNHGWVAQVHQFLEVAHQLDGLLGGFAETRARIKANAVVRNAHFLKLGSTLCQVIAYLAHHVFVLGLILHSTRVVAQHVHYHQARIAVLGNLHHGRVAKARYIVYDAGTRLYGSLGNLGMASIDAYANVLFRQTLDNLNGARKLFFNRNWACARAGGFAAYIDDKRAFLNHFLGCCNRLINVGIRTAIGKRVGGNVQDAHDNGGSRIEGVLPTTPNHFGSSL